MGRKKSADNIYILLVELFSVYYLAVTLLAQDLLINPHPLQLAAEVIVFGITTLAVWTDRRVKYIPYKIIISVLMFFFCFAQQLFSLQTATLVNVIMLLIYAVVLIYGFLKYKRDSIKIGEMVSLFLLMITFTALRLIFTMTSFTASGDFMPRFLIITAIPSVILSVLTVYKLMWKNNPVHKRIGHFFAFVILYCMVCMSFVLGLNFALDNVPCSEYTLPVQNTEVSRSYHRKSIYVAFKFEFDIDGNEVSLPVPRSVYYAYTEGDTHIVRKYEGAFGIPFYISSAYFE